MLHAQKFSNPFGREEGTPRTLVESAYLQVRRDIIEGKLAPGQKLRVEHLKDDYGVGAGTLREALSLLLSDALVLAEGQRGFRVAPISLADIDDITRTRIHLETEALRHSIESGDDDWEASLVAAYHKLTRVESRLGERANSAIHEWDLRNREFHEVLIGACNSRWTRYLLGLLYRQHERYRHLTMARGKVPRDVHAEHEAIFEAAMARNGKLASELLEEHIRFTFESIRLMVPELFGDSASEGRPRRKAKA